MVQTHNTHHTFIYFWGWIFYLRDKEHSTSSTRALSPIRHCWDWRGTSRTWGTWRRFSWMVTRLWFWIFDHRRCRWQSWRDIRGVWMRFPGHLRVAGIFAWLGMILRLWFGSSRLWWDPMGLIQCRCTLSGRKLINCSGPQLCLIVLPSRFRTKCSSWKFEVRWPF